MVLVIGGSVPEMPPGINTQPVPLTGLRCKTAFCAARYPVRRELGLDGSLKLASNFAHALRNAFEDGK
jgi:hypothetical protein